MVRSSRLAQDGSTLLPGMSDPGASRAPLTLSMWSRTRAVSSGPRTRNARGNAERRSARSRHSGTGCNHAPLPGSRRRGSGTTAPSTTTTLSRPPASARVRHPTHVRTGPTADARSVTGAGRAGAGTEPRTASKCSAAPGRPPPARAPGPSGGPLSRPTPTPGRRARRADRRRCGCRSATRSDGPRAGRSAPPCRWPGRAGSPARRPGRCGCARPGW